MGRKDGNSFSADVLRSLTGPTKKIRLRRRKVLFTQGEHADKIFYLDRGAMKLTVTAKDGAEAVVAVFGGGSLLGAGCIDSEVGRQTHSAEALSDSQITEF